MGLSFSFVVYSKDDEVDLGQMLISQGSL